MIKGYSFTDFKNMKYEWNIMNFTDYFKFVDETTTYGIVSSKFDIDNREKPRFYLSMTFSLQSIVCSLKWSSYEERTLLSYQLSIVYKNGETFRTINDDINSASTKVTIENQPCLKVSSSDLLRKASKLFSDNDFKVVCNLTVFGKGMSMGPLNIPKKHQSIKDHFKKLLDSQVGTDVVFEVDGQEFKVHKSILMARSPVFLAMFNNDMIENNSNRVKVEDISSSVFKLLIEFIYTDEVTKKIDVETGIDLLKAASKYQLEGLEALCEAKLCDLLNVNNALDILSTAESHNCTNLVESIKNFITIHQKEIQNNIKPSFIFIK